MKKHFPLFFLCFLLYTQPTKAQTWQPLGPATPNQPTIDSVDATAVSTDNNGNVYLAYSNPQNGEAITVRKFDGNNWTTIGAPGFVVGFIAHRSIAVDGNGIPYLFYIDENAANNQGTVMKYNGSAWVTVGSPEFTAEYCAYINIQINPAGTPYVAFTDNSVRANVMMYNGTNWVQVGNANFSPSFAFDYDFVLDKHSTPYVVFADGDNAYASVMKYNGSSWVFVGNESFSSNEAEYSCIAVDTNGTPYVFYQDDGAGFAGTCMKYNGSSWVPVGGAGFTGGYNEWQNDIVIDRSGHIYVAFTFPVNTNYSYERVMKYNGSTWADATPAINGFDAVFQDWISMAVAPNGAVYVAYEDGANNEQATVLKYNGSAWSSLSLNTFTSTGATFNAMAVDSSNVPFAILGNVASGKNNLYTYNGSNWVQATIPVVSSDSITCTYLANDKYGVLYLIYSDFTAGTTNLLKRVGGNWITASLPAPAGNLIFDKISNNPYSLSWASGFISVQKYNGTQWVNLGQNIVPMNNGNGISEFSQVSMAVANDTPYVSYNEYVQYGGSGGYLLKFDGTNWVSANSIPIPFSPGNFDDVALGNLATDYNNTLYWAGGYADGYTIPYQEGTYDATVWSYNGANAFNLGNTYLDLPAGALLTDKQNTPYMFYADPSMNFSASLIKYDGVSWLGLGNPGFSMSPVYNDYYSVPATDVAIDGNKTFYFVGDGSWGYRLVQQQNPPGIRPPAFSENKVLQWDTVMAYLCQGSTVNLHFDVVGNFNAGNVFNAQLSDITGDFLNPVNLGSLSGTTGGNITVVIPDTMPYGAAGQDEEGYRFRIVSSNPPVNGTASQDPITVESKLVVNAGLNQTLTGCQPVILGGQGSTSNGQGTASGASGYAYSFYWSPAVGLYDPYHWQYNYSDNVWYEAPQPSPYSLSTNTTNPYVTGISDSTTYTVTVYDLYGCTASASATVYVANNNTPGVFITADTSGKKLCPGNPVTFTAAAINVGSSPVYDWYNNGYQVQSGSSITYIDETPYSDDNISCVVQIDPNTLCPNLTSVNSNVISLALDTGITIYVSLTANPGDTFCVNSDVVFTATAVNGGDSALYGWSVYVPSQNTFYDIQYDTSRVLNSSAFWYGGPFKTGDEVFVQVTSSLGCLRNQYEEAAITVTAWPSPAADAGVSQTICPSQGIELGGNPTASGGTTPYTYKWSNGLPASSNPIANSSTTTTYYVTVSDLNNCSAVDSVTIRTGTVPGVTISANSPDTICAGYNVTFTATPATGGTSPTYNWLLNGASVQNGASHVYGNSALKQGDTVKCIMTSNATCVGNNTTAVSNLIGITVISASITANPGDTVCAGNQTIFKAASSITNPLLELQFQWMYNSTFIFNATDTFSRNNIHTGDSIYCNLVWTDLEYNGNIIGCNSNFVKSKTLKMTVDSNVTPTIGITSNLPSKICAGEIGTFHAIATNTGTLPVYTWKINGATVQSGSSAVYEKLFEANTIFGNKFRISCVLTSNAPCASPVTVRSDTIILTLGSKPIRTVINGQSKGVCGGSTWKYTCNAVPGATLYLWVVPNGCTIDSGQNTTSITVTFPANYDSSKIEVVTANNCGTGTPAYLTVKCSTRSEETGEEDLPVAEDIKLNVYPNPNSGQMYIDLEQSEPQPVSYRVYNMMGQTVHEYTASEPTTNFQQQLDLGTQPGGMYFIQMKAGEEVLVRSIVITTK